MLTYFLSLLSRWRADAVRVLVASAFIKKKNNVVKVELLSCTPSDKKFLDPRMISSESFIFVFCIDLFKFQITLCIHTYLYKHDV